MIFCFVCPRVKFVQIPWFYLNTKNEWFSMMVSISEGTCKNKNNKNNKIMKPSNSKTPSIPAKNAVIMIQTKVLS